MEQEQLAVELERLSSVCEHTPHGQERPDTWVKSHLGEGGKVLAEADAFLWDCPAAKDALGRCFQTLAQVNKDNFREDLVSDFRALAAMVRKPDRIARDEVSYRHPNALHELRDILIEYTSGGGMAALGHIDKGKKMLTRWQKENYHPIARLLLNTDSDLTAAEMWLEEVEKQMEMESRGTDPGKFVIFYSWQSVSPNATNRGLIEKALKNAAKSLRGDGSISVVPVIDRDTAGVPGSPNIAEVIFGKIDKCQMFVADVSTVARVGDRPYPNPNVMIELGYAMKALQQERVLLVMNEALGTLGELPFDLRFRRIVTYRAAPEESDRSTPRKDLESSIEREVRVVIGAFERQFGGTKPGSGKMSAETLCERLRTKVQDLSDLHDRMPKWKDTSVEGGILRGKQSQPIDLTFVPADASAHEEVNRLVEKARSWAESWNAFLSGQTTPHYDHQHWVIKRVGACLKEALRVQRSLDKQEDAFLGGEHFGGYSHLGIGEKRPWEI